MLFKAVCESYKDIDTGKIVGRYEDVFRNIGILESSRGVWILEGELDDIRACLPVLFGWRHYIAWVLNDHNAVLYGYGPDCNIISEVHACRFIADLLSDVSTYVLNNKSWKELYRICAHMELLANSFTVF